MAHFAKLDENNIVLEVLVVNNDVLNPSSEEASGIAFLTQLFNGYSNWKQTSYNRTTRGTFAGIGYFYNTEEDIFVAPQPFPSWTRSGSSWNPPTPMPIDGKFYIWNEVEFEWQEIE
jgi:hypothetical protein